VKSQTKSSDSEENALRAGTHVLLFGLFVQGPVVSDVTDGVVFHFEKRDVFRGDVIGNKIQDSAGFSAFILKFFVGGVFADKLTAKPGWLKQCGKIYDAGVFVYAECAGICQEFFGLVIELAVQFVPVIRFSAQRRTRETGSRKGKEHLRLVKLFVEEALFDITEGEFLVHYDEFVFVPYATDVAFDMSDALWAPQDAENSRGFYGVVFDNYVQHLHIIGVYPEGDSVLFCPGVVFGRGELVELLQHGDQLASFSPEHVIVDTSIVIDIVIQDVRTDVVK